MLRVLVIGCGLSGRSAAKLLLAMGWQVSMADKNVMGLQYNPELHSLMSQGVVIRHEDEYDDISCFNLAVISPGIPPSIPLIAKIKYHHIEMIGELELAFRYIQQPVIGITGTNGKTTVTLLVAHILNASGKKARALGNVGTPLAESLSQLDADEIIVAEISSYQLETLSVVIDAGAILNITPDHLDRYESMESYAATKMHLMSCLKPKGKLVMEGKSHSSYSHLCGSYTPELYGYDPALDYSTDCRFLYRMGIRAFELPESLKGLPSHNVENFMAAYALCSMQGVGDVAFLEGYATFIKPKHRIEFVMTIAGVHFFDDSKGTNIDAVMRAVELMPGPTWLIAGGVDKGASYTPWIQAFCGKVKAVFAIGEASLRIKKDLDQALPVYLSLSI